MGWIGTSLCREHIVLQSLDIIKLCPLMMILNSVAKSSYGKTGEVKRNAGILSTGK